MYGHSLPWRTWWILAAVSAGLTVLGVLIFPEFWVALLTYYPIVLVWLALTRRSDSFMRSIPLGFIGSGLVIVLGPSNYRSTADHLVVAAILAAWIALLSAATVWLARRFW